MTPDDETSNWQKRLDRLADERQREATAAVILAALVQCSVTTDVGRQVLRDHADTADEILSKRAVALADALRAALAAKP